LAVSIQVFEGLKVTEEAIQLPRDIEGAVPQVGAEPGTGNRLGGTAQWQGVIRRRWNALPVRWQLMLSISAISIGAVLFSVLLAVFDARERVEVEVSSSMEIAHQLVNDAVRRVASGAPKSDLLEVIPEQLKYIRHARVFATDRLGDLLQVAPDENAAKAIPHPERAPHWFADLVGPKVGTRQIRVMLGADRVGAIVIAGEPRDELAEVWEEVTRRAMIWLGITVVMLALLYVVLGRLLSPLVALAEGMHELEDGRYGARLADPPMHELASIASRFNTLAEALEKSRAENSRLYHNLIAVQENERREIANELHDEAGPCLFGITANAASIDRLATQAADKQTDAIKTRVAEIHSITERLKAINRDLLRNLRPVELGRVSLEELIGSLVAGFARRHPECTFSCTFGEVVRSYGEDIDLTVFRCVQEALTNAMKHGSASRVDIEIGTQRSLAGSATSECVLQVAIRDNGSGIAAGATLGIGITAMRERVHSLGGSSAIDSSPAGTTISLRIPLQHHTRRAETEAVEDTVS